MAASKGMDIIVAFETDASKFRTDDVEREMRDLDRVLADPSATRKWARNYKQATDRIEREVKDTEREVKDSAREAGQEVGNEFAENIGEGLRNGDFAGVALETATSLAGQLRGAWLPLAAALGIGAAVANYIVADLQKRNADIKAAGASLFQAVRDGMLEQAESEEFLTTALGVDSFEDALRKIASLAADMKVPVSEVYAYIESGGKIAGPRLTAQLEKQRDALAKAASNTRGMGENASPVLSTFRTIEGYAGRVRDSVADAKGLLDTVADLTKDPATFGQARDLVSSSNLDRVESVLTRLEQPTTKTVRVDFQMSAADRSRFYGTSREP